MISIKEQVNNYVSENKMRRTKERNSFIECVENMETFDSEKLFETARIHGNSKVSVYNFIRLLSDVGIIKEQEKYVFNLKEK